MTTLSLHSFMRSSQAESIIAAVSWLALRRKRPKSCNVSSTRQHESSRTLASSTGDSLISGEISTQLHWRWTLSTGFGSESAFRCSDVCTRWLLIACRPTANPSPAFLVVATWSTCDRLTVVISTSHVWNLLASYGGRSFAYAGPSNWNSLPAHLRDNSLSLSSFKRQFKTFLFSFY